MSDLSYIISELSLALQFYTCTVAVYDIMSDTMPLEQSLIVAEVVDEVVRQLGVEYSV